MPYFCMYSTSTEQMMLLPNAMGLSLTYTNTRFSQLIDTLNLSPAVDVNMACSIPISGSYFEPTVIWADPLLW
jgi:hypothetical protein